MTTNGEGPIIVNRSLDKKPGLGPIPGDFLYPWASILFANFFVFWAIWQVYPLEYWWPLLTISICLIAHWILFGKDPWKFGGKFHLPKNWVLGYVGLRGGDNAVTKTRGGRARLGAGESKRSVAAIEDEFHLICPVEFYLGAKPVGAYLLHKNKRYRLVFGFEAVGLSSERAPEEIADSVNALRDGLKDFPESETITAVAGSFADDRERQDYLAERIAGVPARLGFLLRGLARRTEELRETGKYNPKYLRFYCTYTFDPDSDRAEDGIERLLLNLQRICSRVSGDSPGREREELTAILRGAFDRGFVTHYEFLRSKLAIAVTPMRSRELFLNDWRRVNGSAPPEKIPQLLILSERGLFLENNSRNHGLTVLFGNGTPKTDKRWVYLPDRGRYVGAVVYREKPGRWDGPLAQLLSGSAPINDRDTHDLEIVCQMSRVDQGQVLRESQRKTKEANSARQFSGRRGVIDVGASLNVEENVRLEEDLLRDEVVLSTAWLALLYRRTPRELALATRRFEALFRRPASVVRETEYADVLWVESFPFAWRPLLQKPFDRRDKYLSKELPGILPVNFEMTRARSGVCLIGDKGSTPLFVDPFTKPLHIGVFGTTGAGKSLVCAEFLTQALGDGFKVIVIDSTRGDGSGTFDRYTDFVGGAYYNTARESNNFLEAIDFTTIDDPKKREAQEGIFHDFVVETLLTLTLAPNADLSLKKNYKSVFNQALHRFFEDGAIARRYRDAYRAGLGTPEWRRIPVLGDFLPFLKELRDSEDASDFLRETIAKIVFDLNAVLANPVLGRTLASPSSFASDSDLVVYAIGTEDEDELAPLALSAYAAAFRRSFTCSKVLIYMDEASVLMKFPAFSSILGSLLAKGRKSGISVLYSGQDLESIVASASADQILKNTAAYLIGRIASNAVNTMESKLDIPASLLRKATGDDFHVSDELFASRWLLKQGGFLSPCTYYGAYEQLALLANEPETARTRDGYFARYGNPYRALREFTDFWVNRARDTGGDRPGLLRETP